MKLRIWPRTLRLQLLGGLVLLEALSLLLFGLILVRQQESAIRSRAQQRLLHQANSLVVQAKEGLMSDRPESAILTSVRMLAEAPSVESARITDPEGKVLFESSNDSQHHDLEPIELEEISQRSHNPSSENPWVIEATSGGWESVKPIVLQGKLYGYAWVKTDQAWDQDQIKATTTSISIFAIIWIGASGLLAWALALSITRPLAVLHGGTQALMQSTDGPAPFPLPEMGHNEIGDLIVAFNRMFASIEEQRAGLSDTLSLLDSMLAHAPIGLAFFDRNYRFVRINRVFSEATGLPLSRHLGRTLPEVLPASVAGQLERVVQRVFESNLPVRDVEVTGSGSTNSSELGMSHGWTWIAGAYPVHSTLEEVRWVGLIVMDASERKRSEEALRKTEKLAATGRLAASIAHEINNPLEAITNLLYLLSNYPDLDESARGFAQMAEFEVRRISEITQQTLRFYRQSTLPTRAKLSELLDSVLTLHQGRLRNLGISVERDYDTEIDLNCFAGELRQVFANLVGNAIDAMPEGGRLSVRARRSRDWSDTGRRGVRFQVSDTGSGMKPGVRKRIFEPFFTTKEVTGTGLGLWVSSEIVAKHKGTIRVRSYPGESGGPTGTVFELFFPDSAELRLQPEQEVQASAPVGSI